MGHCGPISVGALLLGILVAHPSGTHKFVSCPFCHKPFISHGAYGYMARGSLSGWALFTVHTALDR